VTFVDTASIPVTNTFPGPSAFTDGVSSHIGGYIVGASGQFAEGNIDPDARVVSDAEKGTQIAVPFGKCPWMDGSVAYRKFAVGDNKIEVDSHGPSETLTFRARTERIIE
jgi:hypothetical protein